MLDKLFSSTLEPYKATGNGTEIEASGILTLLRSEVYAFRTSGLSILDVSVSPKSIFKESYLIILET